MTASLSSFYTGSLIGVRDDGGDTGDTDTLPPKPW
jgi:hypothetical protein